MLRLIVLMTLTGLLGQTWASDEDAINDLRLEFSPLLGREFRQAGPSTDLDPDFQVFTTQNVEFGYNQTLRSHTREDLAYYYSVNDLEADRGSFLIGVAVARDRTVTQGHSYGSSWILDLFAGWAWAFTPAWHLEEGIILGAGRTAYRLHAQGWWDDGTDWDSESNGFCYEYGARIGTYYTFAHLQVGLDLCYLVTQSYLHFNATHVNSTDGTVQANDWSSIVRVQGFGGSLSTGWRF